MLGNNDVIAHFDEDDSPILCYVWDNARDKNTATISLIIEVDYDGKTHLFSSVENNWLNARPLTKREAMMYLL